MRKQISLLLMIFLLCNTVVSAYAEGVKLGDANGDGDVSSTDAALIIRHTINSMPYEGYEHYDVNGDGTISSLDAALVIKKTIDNSFVFPGETTSEETTEATTSETTTEATTSETTTEATTSEYTVSIKDSTATGTFYVGNTIKAETNIKDAVSFKWLIGDKATSGNGVDFIVTDGAVDVTTSEGALELITDYVDKYIQVTVTGENGATAISRVVGPVKAKTETSVNIKLNDETVSGSIDVSLNDILFIDTNVSGDAIGWLISDSLVTEGGVDLLVSDGAIVVTGSAIGIDVVNSNNLPVQNSYSGKYVIAIMSKDDEFYFSNEVILNVK